MFRTARYLARAGAPRSLPRHIASPRIHFSKTEYNTNAMVAWQLSQRIRYSTNRPTIDLEAERKRAKEKLKADPSQVSMESTTRKAFDNSTLPGQSVSTDDERIQDGLMHDLVCSHSPL